jgi:hypothetical protein
MIAFKKAGPTSSFTRSDLDEILDGILSNKGKFNEGAKVGGLHPTEIQDIVAFLMFEEGNSSVRLTVEKEADNYHLALIIENKQKNP